MQNQYAFNQGFVSSIFGQSNTRLPNPSKQNNNQFANASTFGHSGAFGQSGTFGQSSTFGQQSNFSQPSSLGQSRTFGHTSTFRQPSTFLGQSNAFVKPSTFGQTNTRSTGLSNQNTNQFGNSSMFGAFNRSVAQSTYTTNQLPTFNRNVNAFDQVMAQSADPRKVNSLNQSQLPIVNRKVVVQKVKVSERSSAFNQNFSQFNQPKRGRERCLYSISNRRRGREGAAIVKRGGFNVISNSFQRKNNDKENDANRRPAITNIRNMTTSSTYVTKTTAADLAIGLGGTSKATLYYQFKEDRDRERQEEIKRRFMSNPINPTTLSYVVDFRGTCQTMCPKFEMLEREIQNDLDNLEMDSQGNMDPRKAVKAYRRLAAGLDHPLLSDVRPPEVLIKTLYYLFDNILSNHALENCYAFLLDRTRSIQQDLTLQNIRDIDAVRVLERIARFHILCLHEMCELDEPKFFKQQGIEQLNKALVSLMEFYDDLRNRGIETENEGEFRAYNLLSHISDQDIACQAMTIPIHIFKSPYITRALEFRELAQRNYASMESSSAFFKLIQESGTPFLMACMLENYFAEVRKSALKAMNASYMMKAGGVQAERIRKALGYDAIEQLLEEASVYGIIINNIPSLGGGMPTLWFGQKHYLTKLPYFIEPLSNPPQKKSLLLVEPKKAGRTYREIVNGIHHSVIVQQHNASTRNLVEIMRKNSEAKPAWVLEIEEKAQSERLLKERKMKEEKMRKDAAAAAAAITAEEEIVAFQRKRFQEVEEKMKAEAAQKKESERLLQEEIMRKRAAAAESMAAHQRKNSQELEEQLVKEARREEYQRLLEKEKMKQEMMRRQEKAKREEEEMKQQLKELVLKKAKAIVMKKVEAKLYIKNNTKPWLSRARARIQKRVAHAMERKSKWKCNMYMVCDNPYIPSDDTIYKATPAHSIPEGIKDRVNQSILVEKIALEDTSSPTVVDAESLWKAEDFSSSIYPRIKDKIFDLKKSRAKHDESQKPNWQLLISAPDSECDSSVWFRRKFDLDNTFLRKYSFYQDFNIVARMNTPKDDISCQVAEEVGAIIFSLPESKMDKNPEEFASYWKENEERLEKLMDHLRYYNPGMRVPVLFTYFPDSTSTESTLEKLPQLLGLHTKRLISDYHILVMNRLTITDRLKQELNWLSNNTIINQE